MQDCTDRAAHPCIGKDRADLIVAGCAILTAICELWPVDDIRVADRGVREGILVDLLSQYRHENETKLGCAVPRESFFG